MFLTNRHAAASLPPESYRSERQLDGELRRVFHPAWHLVATLDDIPNPGDFVSVDVLGSPLVVRNCEGSVRAFLNVCAHRHCLLTAAERGHMERLTCQYHGWQYDDDGGVRKLPDGRSFGKIDRADLRLRTFPVGRCGRLLFVRLPGDGPSLEDYLGPAKDEIAAAFGSDSAQQLSYDRSHGANWKVVVENALESYHIPSVHAQTFGQCPDEAAIEHRLGPHFTRFETPSRVGPLHDFFVRLIRREPRFMYTHQHCFPALLLVWGDYHAIAQAVFPTSSTTCQSRIRMYCHRGDRPILRRRPVQRLLFQVYRRTVIEGTLRVFAEDERLFPSVQRGVECSPHAGVLSAREERIHFFHEWVAERLNGASGGSNPYDPARGTPGAQLTEAALFALWGLPWAYFPAPTVRSAGTPDA